MTVKIITGEVLDLDDLPSLTLWVRDHIEVTDAHIIDYDDSSGICLSCSVVGVQDLGLVYPRSMAPILSQSDEDSDIALEIYADLIDDADHSQARETAGGRP